MNKNTKNLSRSHSAFTMIEILVVITIMGIIAAMIIEGGQYASRMKKETAVKAELAKLTVMIDNYQAKLGYYPPDNNNVASVTVAQFQSGRVPGGYWAYTAESPLLYELTGATNNSATTGNATIAVFTGAVMAVPDYNAAFGRSGVANSSISEPQNFFKPPPRLQDYTNFTGTPSSPLNKAVYGLLVPAPVSGVQSNFWHYDCSSQFRHNQNTYDLWAEYTVGTKNGNPLIITNGNW